MMMMEAFQKECFRGNDPTKCNTKIIQTRNSEGTYSTKIIMDKNTILQISVHLQHSVLFGMDEGFLAHQKCAERFSKALPSWVFGRFC
jgi:hypothetical protein